MRDWQPVQRAERLASRGRFIQAQRVRTRLICHQRDDRVHLRIDALDLFQMRAQHIARGEFPSPHAPHQVSGRQPANFRRPEVHQSGEHKRRSVSQWLVPYFLAISFGDAFLWR